MKEYRGLKAEKIALPESSDIATKSGCWAMVAYTQEAPSAECYETQNPTGNWVGQWLSPPDFGE